MDIRVNIDKDIVLGPMKRAVIRTGIFLEIPASCEAQIRPRSGMTIIKGITVLNTPVTISTDYRDEVNITIVKLPEDKSIIKDRKLYAR